LWLEKKQNFRGYVNLWIPYYNQYIYMATNIRWILNFVAWHYPWNPHDLYSM